MITQDRWQRIKEIFHSARDRTPAERLDFVNEVCGDDESMREEVETLLAADAGNDDFLSAPAYEFAAGILASEASEFSAGQRVGRYTILCALGAGGMGQIYLAQDTVLGRKIALKLISPEFATDPGRVHRFEQEARAASALNHPNVCVIHEIGITDNGRHFIAMEYIEGLTLRDQLSLGTFKPIEALRIAVQVSAALASAHAASIVHHDIKPENIMLRPDGYVKVVDFGLAKLTEVLPEPQYFDELSAKVGTEPRTLMGTVKYMSPEQLREAAQVDERTDIWSLGVVLYEMLTGLTPFEARSPKDTIARILDSQPSELLLPGELPNQVREIVRRMLEKDRAERYQTVTKLVSDLNTLQWELERNGESYISALQGIQPPLVLYPPGGHGQGTRKAEISSAIVTRTQLQAISTAKFLFSGIRSHKAAALFVGATTVLALLLFLPNLASLIREMVSPDSTGPQTTTLVRAAVMKPLTNAGTSVCSAISFDGKFVAHAEEQNGRQYLVVTNTATFGSSVAVPPDDVRYLSISFARNNNYLYFMRQEGDIGVLYRLALPDGTPIKLREGIDSPISFSPQGDRFAFIRFNVATREYSLMLSDIDGANEQVIASRNNGETFSAHGVAWSPDGGMVICPSGHWAKGFHMNLVGFDLKGGQERAIGDQSWFSIVEVAWQEDMTGLVISARERPTTPQQLWRITFPDGVAQRITNDLADYRGVSLSGENIVTVRTNQSWRLWVATLDDFEKATAIVSGVGLSYGLSWTTKGKIIFSSMAQDKLNISRVDPDGSHQVQLTVDAGDNYTPVSSPDGRFIVFASNRNGAFNIWRINAEDGSNPKQLTFSDGNFYPSCSSDNQWVAYANQLNSELSVWKAPLEGADPIRMSENDSIREEKYLMPVSPYGFLLCDGRPTLRPDNQFLACSVKLISGSRNGTWRELKIPIQEWQQVEMFEHGQSYINNVNGYSNIWSFDLTGAKQLTNFKSDQIYAYAWSPDYKQVAYQRGSKISDVTMINNKQ